jgi:signal transduction histidine kinase
MKLTWRLSIAVGTSVLLLLVAHAVVRVERDVARFRESVRTDHHTLAIALAAAVARLARSDGISAIPSLVAEVDRSEPNMSIHWVYLDAPVEGATAPRVALTAAHVPGAYDSETLTGTDRTDTIVTHVVVDIPDQGLTAIEIEEPLTRQEDYAHEAIVRTASTTAVVITLCIALILGFGVFFVGRPLEALRRQAIRIGRGEGGARTTVRSADEIGELGREMNTMAAALEAARQRVRHEEAARIETLAQLKHADRLRAVGELASAIAHDLGAPLASVAARAHLIAEEDRLDRVRELARSIVSDVEGVSRSVRRLLDHGRRDVLAKEDVDLADLVGGVLELVEPIAYDRGIHLVAARAAAPLRVHVDALQVRHVVLNLVMNALDASPASATIEITTAREDGRVVVRVRDHGSGVDPENLERVFEPFFTTKAPGEGTGLGLSIARAIVVEHHGRLRAENATGGGTVVIMTLPCAPDDAAGSD